MSAGARELVAIGTRVLAYSTATQGVAVCASCGLALQRTPSGTVPDGVVAHHNTLHRTHQAPLDADAATIQEAP